MPIIKNQISGHVGTLDFSNVTYTTANLASPNTDVETVTSMGLSKIMWTGDWSIKQGSNVIFQTAANTSGFFDFTAQGLVIQGANTAANITANTAGSTSTLCMSLTKYARNTVGV